MNYTANEEKESSVQAIKARYYLIKQSNPNMRARNAAMELGISEGELLAARIGEGVVRLIDDAETILKSIISLGDVMALTRNEFCVHERKGRYDRHEFFKHGKTLMGVFVNPEIDLRLFMDHWKHAFAVTEQTPTGFHKSLQFFDKAGQAVHKVYLTENSDESAYNKLIDDFRNPHQDFVMQTESDLPTLESMPDSEIDWQRVKTEWESLKDIHDFNPMLRKFKLEREQAYSKIGKRFAYQLERSSARYLLEIARDRECEIMVFVGNHGCIQIHTGHVNRLEKRGVWYNVLDPRFNLHLREDGIARIWVTKKPTQAGIVTSLELFDQYGKSIASFLGKQEPEGPESQDWRDIIDQLPEKESDKTS